MMMKSRITFRKATICLCCAYCWKALKLSPDSLATILLRKSDLHDLEGVKLMLANGADPNRMTPWGYTALHQSLRRDNSLEIVQAILDHGLHLHLRNLQTTNQVSRWLLVAGAMMYFSQCSSVGFQLSSRASSD